MALAEWGTSDYWDERYADRDEPEVCYLDLYSAPDLVKCIVDDCDLMFHRECGARCHGCNKPVCLEHAKEHGEGKYCPGCLGDVQDFNESNCSLAEAC